MKGTVLIIDDEEGLRKLLTRIVTLEGYEVLQGDTLKAGLDILKHRSVDVILCDVKLPDGNGVDFVKEVKARFPLPEIILLTAYGNIPDGVQAIKNGAFDYITKGDDNDRILPLLSQAIDNVAVQKKSAVKIGHDNTTLFSSIIGNSAAIKQTILLAQKISSTNTTVLLLGETGTGKEVFAKAIHAEGRRSAQTFIAINCSAFTKDLLEGELFGHKAGAYTGALKDKKGLVEVADKGTLFLDEIGEMNIDLQAKLLRVLEGGEFIKLGDVKTTKVDVRIITATNRDLTKEVEEGRFREDLFYRLNTFTISLPPLRERREDIKELSDYFLKLFCNREGKPLLQLSGEALKIMQNHQWKGNIRELKNIVERTVILAEGTQILPHDLPIAMQQASDINTDEQTLSAVEKTHIKKILAHTGNNKTKAAVLLGIGLATLYRKLDEYHLNK
ncbi:MAG: two component, sigma54 specific, transcriptional regulator, Fis family [Flavisolibacter sp.]|jgi:two-component system NtrC family response regulator|nr:two component, sigma54 specific, transcriptional regulator, Fis family [Flavisolibacter sp.]